MAASLKLNRFDPRTMEKRRRDGNPSTCIFIGKRGSGKCFSLNTPIMLFDGSIKNVQDVKIGDQLMGDDSTPRNVLNLSKGESIMYKVKQTNGDDYIINENHILSLQDDNLGDKIDIPVKDYLKLSTMNLKGYKVGIEFPEQKIPFDPYLLGVWLSENNSNYILNSLKSLDLVNKYIPQIYKFNSRENLLRILAGLLDTDGYLNQETNVYEIIQKTKQLAIDIQFIARSLGFMCNMEESQNGTQGIYYLMHISGNKIEEIPCLDKRKQATTYNKNCLLTEIEIEKLDYGEYFGFEVDKNHRFLLGDFTVTHNSTLISDIMYFHRSVPYGMIMSGTEEGNGFYGGYFPPLFIHSTFKKELVESIVKRQKKILKNSNVEPLDKHAFLLIDDMMYDKSVTKDKNMRLIFMNGRHWKLLFILSMQYCMDLPPDLRANVDYIFILRENIIDNQRKLWKYFFGMYDKFSDFQQTLSACTENYECLVLDNTSKSNKVEDCVFWYKATPDRTYRIGCPQLWAYAKKHYDADYDNKEEESEESTKVTRKQSLIIKKGIKEPK